MLLQIQRSADVYDKIPRMKVANAKYLTIAGELRREILAGKYASGQRFPSEEMLVRRFRVSRPTVERALRELKREHLLESRAGSGSYLTFTAINAMGSLGIIAPDYRKIDFFTDLCDQIVAAARKEGYDTLLGDVSAPETEDRGVWALELAKVYATKRIAGVLLEPVDLIPDSHDATRRVLEVLAARRIPVVLLDRDYLPAPDRSAYDLVGIDNEQAGYRLARHLIDCGARNIRFLTQRNYASTIRGRIHGVGQAVIDAGLSWKPSHIVETDPSDTAAFARLLRGKNAPDAFVCRNDPTAAHLLQTLTFLGFHVPNDIRIAGFDDGKIAQFLNPPLTTIHQPVRALAETAVASLLQRIHDPKLPPRAIRLDAPLVIRRSTVRGAERKYPAGS